MRDIPSAQGILLGLLFLAAGLAIVFVALDWIRVDPSSIHAPRWVLGVCGAIFAVPGAGILYYGIRNAIGGPPPSARPADEDVFPVVGWFTGMVVSAGMTAVSAWIAFGPGERAFSGSIGIGGVGVGGPAQSETVGRWVFGIGAVLAGLFTVWGVMYGIRRLSSGRR